MARKVGEIKFQAGKIFFINFGLILWGELFIDNFYWIKIFFDQNIVGEKFSAQTLPGKIRVAQKFSWG